MTEPDSTLLRVATVGVAHGLKGDVRLNLHTDEPEGRLAVGSSLPTDPAGAGPLTVAALRRQHAHWYARFEGVTDRTGAEALRGVVLLAEPSVTGEEDAWYPHELAGLRAETPDGRVLGEVEAIEHLPAHDMLVLREVSGERTLVPFVTAIVPVVDVAGGRVVVDPPYGLLAGDDPDGHGDADDGAGTQDDGTGTQDDGTGQPR